MLNVIRALLREWHLNKASALASPSYRVSTHRVLPSPAECLPSESLPVPSDHPPAIR